MEGVAGKAIADQFAVNAGAAALRMLVFFKHHGAGAFAHHEAVAIAVIGTRGALGGVVESGGQRAARGKSGKRQAVDGQLRTAGDHHVSIAESDEPAGVADGVSPRRAGGDYGRIRTLEPVGNRDIAGSQIDDAARNEERRYAARPAVAQQQGRFRDAFNAADAGADQDSAGDLVFVSAGMPVGIVERLLRRRHAEQNKVVDLALLFRLHPLVGVETAVGAVAARKLAGDLAGKIGRFRNSQCARSRFRQRAAAATSARPRKRAASPCQDQ